LPRREAAFYPSAVLCQDCFYCRFNILDKLCAVAPGRETRPFKRRPGLPPGW
jgi:hypothetical protein